MESRGARDREPTLALKPPAGHGASAAVSEPQPGTAGPTVPVSAEHAAEFVRREFGFRWPDGSEAPLDVHEFHLGYIVYVAQPSRDDPHSPPADPGGSCLVINKATGEISTLPERPAELVIDIYRRYYRPQSNGPAPTPGDASCIRC